MHASAITAFGLVVSKLLQIICQICIIDTGGVPVFNTPVQGEPVNSGPQNFESRN